MIVQPGLRRKINSQSALLKRAQMLFTSNNYDGALYIAGDKASLFQDSAGTTPVSVVTDPIGRQLDRSGNTNHSLQATAAARPTWSNRVNLLTYSEDFSNAVWATAVAGTGVSATKTPNFGIAPDGTQTACRVQLDKGVGTTTNDWARFVQTFASAAGIVGGFWIKTNDGSTKQIDLNIVNQDSITVNGTWAWYSTTGATAATAISIFLRGGLVPANDNTADLLVWHPQVEFGTTFTRYQRVTTATGFDTAGFPYYESLLGTDDCFTSSTGGGGTTGFFWCGAIQPTGGALTQRRLFGDYTATNGYTVFLNGTNKLQIAAGNGVGFTTKASTATVDVGTKYLLTAWDDGVNLNIQINAGIVESIARPVVAAGTAGFTRFQDNGAAANYFIGYEYASVYVKDSGLTSASREDIKKLISSYAGL